MCISLLFAGAMYLTNNIKGEDWFLFVILGHLVSACSVPCTWADYYSWILSSQCSRQKGKREKNQREKRTRDRMSPRTQPCALLPLAVLNTLDFSEFHSILPTKDRPACGDLNCNTWAWDWRFIFRPSHSVVKTYIDFLHSVFVLLFALSMCGWYWGHWIHLG